MTSFILQTKLSPPQLPGGTLARQDLLAKIQPHTGRRLAIVQAPAGYGKTTLACEWVRSNGLPTAWLSLDPEDNDPARFLAYLTAALQTVAPGVGTSLQAALTAPELPPLRTLLDGLLNDLSRLSREIALVMDDFHFLTGDALQKDLVYFIDYLPAQLRLLLTSRSEPHMPLARWRSRGQLVEIDTADLQFSSEETAEFLRQRMGLLLAAPDLLSLHAQTDGWAAAVQLAAISLQKRGHGGMLTDGLSAHEPLLAEYLLEEVFGSAAAPIQVFLLETCLPEQITGDLCAALNGRKDCAAILENLAQANLPLTRLENGWYRYHPLLRDFLVRRLESQFPEKVPFLHRAAGEWYAAHDQVEQAIPHLLAAGENHRAAQLTAQASPDMLQRGEWLVLRRWLDHLPDDVVFAEPRLCTTRIWMLLETYQPGASTPYMDRLGEHLKEHPDPALLCEHLAIRAVQAAMNHQPQKALELAGLAVDSWVAGDPFVGSYAAFALGAAYKMSYDFPQAEHWLRQAAALASAARNGYMAFSAYENLGDFLLLQGRLAEAEAAAQRAIDTAAAATGIEPPYTAWAHHLLGRIHLERNQLDHAVLELERSLVLCGLWGNHLIAARSGAYLAKAWRARLDYDEAQNTLDDAEQKARLAGDPTALFPVLRERVFLALARGDLSSAGHWLQVLAAAAETQQPFDFSASQIRYCLARGQPQEAIQRITHAASLLPVPNLTGHNLQLAIYRALALRSSGHPEKALPALEEALVIGQPGGFVQVFLEGGAPIQELLRRAAGSSPHAAYIGQLLAAFQGRLQPVPEYESLTGRELQILRLLAAGYSNREIAERLVIAESTLKRHLSNLYHKLQVHSRTQALKRAADLSLL